jgi:hypothetical protein
MCNGITGKGIESNSLKRNETLPTQTLVLTTNMFCLSESSDRHFLY